MCYSCAIENATFMNLGVIRTNLIRDSYLTKIMVHTLLDREKLVLCQSITLTSATIYIIHKLQKSPADYGSNQH